LRCKAALSPAQENSARKKISPTEALSGLRVRGNFSPIACVDTERLSIGLKDALLGLLDDTSSPVRRALLLHFAQHGPAALCFLKEIAQGSNRVLAWHARWFIDELKFTDPVAEFKSFIRSLNYELETGALLLSRTVNPDLDIGACCTLLDTMAGRCRELIIEPATTREKCRVINRVLFAEYGFHGNVEHSADPLNNFIDQVLSRRKGLPSSLSLVYLLVAHRLGLTLEPVSLPGHFVIGCYLEDKPFFIDAFDKGIFRSTEELFAFLRSKNFVPKTTDLAPTPVREVLCFSCRNLVTHYTAAGDLPHARLFNEFVEEFETTYERHARP
jgi:regulator of sirC expression with transglutaminase-like and TPR domain